MSHSQQSFQLRGTLFALLGGTCWGFSGACGQYIFGHYGADTLWVSSLRIIGAGIVLLLVCLARKNWRNDMARLCKDGKGMLQLVLFAVFGLAFCQIAYLMAIRYSNAGTATVLQYIGPVLIVILMCIKQRQLPTKKEVMAVLCVVVGTFLVATHGNFNNLALSPLGLTWGLLAALGAVFYTLIPMRIMAKYGSVPVLALGSVIAGVVVNIWIQPWSAGFNMPWDGWLALAGLTIVGAVLGFAFYLQGVNDIGASKTSLLGSVETISATLFAVLWLGTSFELIDLVGFVFIMATVFLLYKKPTASS